MSESIKISAKVITSIFNSSLRVSENQTRMYGILFGNKTYDSYFIKDCLFGAMTECEKKENETNIFQTPTSAQTEALVKSYLSNHQTESILGGFTTDKELFSELAVLNFVINKIPNDKFSIHNDLVLLYDTSNNIIKANDVNSAIKLYKWNKETVTNKEKKTDLSLVTFEEKRWEISTLDYTQGENFLINKDVINEEKIFYEIDDWEAEADKEIEKIIDDFAEIENSKFLGKDVKDGLKEKIDFIKREIFVCVKYLDTFEKFVNKISEKESLTEKENDILDKIFYVLANIKDSFEREDVVEVIKADTQRNKILDSLVSLLNAQIKITEKINYMHFGE